MTTGTVNLHIDDWFSCVNRRAWHFRKTCAVHRLFARETPLDLPRNARGARLASPSVPNELAPFVSFTATWRPRPGTLASFARRPPCTSPFASPPAARAGPRRPPRPRASRSPPPPPPRWPPSTPPSPLFLFLFRAPRASVSATSRPPAARFARAAPRESLQRRVASLRGCRGRQPRGARRFVSSRLLRESRSYASLEFDVHFRAKLLRGVPPDLERRSRLGGYRGETPAGGFAGRVTCAGRPRSLRSVSRAVRASASTSAARDAASSDDGGCRVLASGVCAIRARGD